jgi:small subunit ribosomal protein S11
MAEDTVIPAPAPAETAPPVAPVAPVAPATPPAGEKTGGDKAVSASVWLSIGGEGAEAPKLVKAKGSKNINSGIVHVVATFNNTLVSVTDKSGNLIGWSSAGKMGFKGSRKGTAYAAQVVSQDACRQAMTHGLKEAEVRLKGPGSGRESAVRAVQALGIDIVVIKDVTPVPHNGCRPPKARRV